MIFLYRPSLVLLFPHSIIIRTTHTHIHTCVHMPTIMRGPSLLQHMLGCLAEATLTACLTAASVCYEHGPVSTALFSSSLRPPFLYASLLVLSYLYHSLPCLLGSGSSKQSQICAYYYYGTVLSINICGILILSLTFVYFLHSLIFYLSRPDCPVLLLRCWLCLWLLWCKWGAEHWANYAVKIQPYWLIFLLLSLCCIVTSGQIH